MQQPEITLQSLDTKLNNFFETFQQFTATVIAKFTSLEDGHQEVMEFMRDNLVTHSELDDAVGQLRSDIRGDIGTAKHEIMDYVDKKDTLYKGELISSLRKEDVKIDQTIDTLEQYGAIKPADAERLQQLGPFQR